MREMADQRHDFVVLGGRDLEDAAADLLPKSAQFRHRCGIGRAVRREDARRILKQLRPRRADAGLLRAGHRMTPHKAPAPAENLPQFRHHRRLHAAHICDDRLRRNRVRNFARQRRHGPDRHAQNHQVHTCHDRAHIRRDRVGDPHRLDLRHRLRAPRPERHARPAQPPRGQREGAAEQAGTEDGEGVHRVEKKPARRREGLRAGLKESAEVALYGTRKVLPEYGSFTSVPGGKPRASM